MFLVKETVRNLERKYLRNVDYNIFLAEQTLEKYSVLMNLEEDMKNM